jgi:hypothetical protein
VTAKQRVVLGALRAAQHEHDGQAVSARQIATACPAPWQGRPDLVTRALVLLERHGLVLAAAGSARAWKSPAAGRLMLAPRRGPARERPVIGRGPHPARRWLGAPTG